MATQTKIPPLTVSNPWWGHDPSDKQWLGLCAYEECPDLFYGGAEELHLLEKESHDLTLLRDTLIGRIAPDAGDYVLNRAHLYRDRRDFIIQRCVNTDNCPGR